MFRPMLENLDQVGKYWEYDILIVTEDGTEDGTENITKYPFGPKSNIIGSLLFNDLSLFQPE